MQDINRKAINYCLFYFFAIIKLEEINAEIQITIISYISLAVIRYSYRILPVEKAMQLFYYHQDSIITTIVLKAV